MDHKLSIPRGIVTKNEIGTWWCRLFSFSGVSNSLWPHGLQHTRPPCPSPSPGACSNSCPLSQWCHPTILSSVIPFSSCLQSLPASGSFPMSQLFISGGQSIGASASASVLLMNTQGLFPLGLTGLISLQSNRLSRVFSNTTVQKHQFFHVQPSLWSNCPYTTTAKTMALTRWTFVGKVISLFFNTLSWFVITFLPKSKHLLLSCPQSPSTVILEPTRIKSVTISIVSPSICHEVMGLDAMILVFKCWGLSKFFSLFSFTVIKRPFSSSLLSSIRMVSSAYLRVLVFLPAILIPVCASSNLAFCMIYSAKKLNKQGDNTQPWRTPFPIWNQFVVPRLVLTVASWPAYRFLSRQVRWSGIPISLRIFQFVVIHTVKVFSIINEIEVDFFFFNSLAFSMIQWMLALWSLVPLPFLNTDTIGELSKNEVSMGLPVARLSWILQASVH